MRSSQHQRLGYPLAMLLGELRVSLRGPLLLFWIRGTTRAHACNCVWQGERQERDKWRGRLTSRSGPDQADVGSRVGRVMPLGPVRGGSVGSS